MKTAKEAVRSIHLNHSRLFTQRLSNGPHPRPTNHDTRPTTHDPRPTTHDPRPTTIRQTLSFRNDTSSALSHFKLKLKKSRMQVPHASHETPPYTTGLYSPRFQTNRLYSRCPPSLHALNDCWDKSDVCHVNVSDVNFEET